jgi:hypothetical protein
MEPIMNEDQHRERHIELHKALDELFADYIIHHPEENRFTDMPVMRLLEWAHEQTLHPTKD